MSLCQPDEFVVALEAVSGRIRDPVVKLRYIRAALARYQRVDRVVRRIPFSFLRVWTYRWISLDGLSHLKSTGPLASPLSVDAGVRRSLLGMRLAAAALVLALGLGVGELVRRVTQPMTAAAAPVLAPARSSLPPVAEALQPLPKGIAPARIWQVESGDGWEQYSNGLRIESLFAVAGDPRRYRVFDERSGMLAELADKPGGILFHTSESDIWPLEASFNGTLNDSSHRLLRYVQKGKLYNYLIDRFGRVFRVVEERAKANHAGFSIWAHAGRVYLSLNHAFLGVCFESRWGGGHALPVTAAQLVAARSLTDYLRQKWQIAPEMCVAHGLTSVNPTKHLIGHHVDWARGFPFEAFGLPDQYAQVPASVGLFGFGYDEQFVAQVGEPWAGVQAGERAIEEQARREGKAPNEVRRARRALYDQWLGEQKRDEETRAAGRADQSNGG